MYRASQLNYQILCLTINAVYLEDFQFLARRCVDAQRLVFVDSGNVDDN